MKPVRLFACATAILLASCASSYDTGSYYEPGDYGSYANSNGFAYRDRYGRPPDNGPGYSYYGRYRVDEGPYDRARYDRYDRRRDPSYDDRY